MASSRPSDGWSFSFLVLVLLNSMLFLIDVVHVESFLFDSTHSREHTLEEIVRRSWNEIDVARRGDRFRGGSRRSRRMCEARIVSSGVCRVEVDLRVCAQKPERHEPDEDRNEDEDRGGGGGEEMNMVRVHVDLCRATMRLRGDESEQELDVSLPLPTNLYGIDGEVGARLVFDAQTIRGPLLRALSGFQTQGIQTTCSIASSVTALIALQVTPAPIDPRYAPYPFFTQESIWSNPCWSSVVSRSSVYESGMDLDTFEKAFSTCFGDQLNVTKVYASQSTLDEFRSSLKRILQRSDALVIVNYLHAGVGEIGGGHFSPLAAYSPVADRALVLDVAQYKYPFPAFIPVELLFSAMNTFPSNDSNSRGYILLERVPL